MIYVGGRNAPLGDLLDQELDLPMLAFDVDHRQNPTTLLGNSEHVLFSADILFSP